MRGGTTTGADFREAARHEHELNERQREVLALLSSGLTNAEIGERLGMTLDGAKWNVSEILTKLGLESREEAAEYWRWRHGGVWARVRGWLGAPLLKIAGAGAATVLGVGVVAALSSEDEPPVVDEPGRPFYLEADIRVSSNARTIGTNVVGATPPADPEETRGVMRWAWQDRDHFRVDYETTEPGLDSGNMMILGDGQQQWVLNELENTYHESDLYTLPPEYRVRPTTMSVLLGPLPLPPDADTVDEVLELLKDWPSEDGWGEVVREDSILGRRVVVIVWGPAACSGSGGTRADGSRWEEESCDGQSELWLDPERMMVMRHRLEADVQSFDGVLTRLDYDTEFEASRFTFVPPLGSRPSDEDPTVRTHSTITHASDAPPGFLRMGPTPRGYESIAQSQGGSASGAINSVEQEFRGPDDAVLRVSQRKRAMPDALMVGQEHEARGLVRYSTTLESGWTRVAWEEAGVTVVLEAESMPVEQLLAIAGSMKVVE